MYELTSDDLDFPHQVCNRKNRNPGSGGKNALGTYWESSEKAFLFRSFPFKIVPALGLLREQDRLGTVDGAR